MSPLPEHSDDLRVLGRPGSLTKLLTGWTAPNWAGSLGSLCHQSASPTQLGENEARKLLVGCTRVLDLMAPAVAEVAETEFRNQIVPHGTLLSFSLKQPWKSVSRAQWEYTFLNFIFHFWDQELKNVQISPKNQVWKLTVKLLSQIWFQMYIVGGEAVKV